MFNKTLLPAIVSMNTKEFIYKTIQLYHSARLSKPSNPKIKRGRSHSISSILEDLFAFFLISNIKADRIYVDQPISVASVKIKNYPDISIVRNKTITSFCDLKTDLGWNRDGLVDLCRHHYRWIKKSKGKNCVLKDGVTKKEIRGYKIDKRATYNVVIVSERGINPKSLNEQIAQAHKLFYPTVEVFVLAAKEHLNAYGISPKALMRKIEIRTAVFRKLIKKLNA